LAEVNTLTGLVKKIMPIQLKMVRLQLKNGSILALIALFSANHIARIVDFKMIIINDKTPLFFPDNITFIVICFIFGMCWL
jgi:hypothetical protein